MLVNELMTSNVESVTPNISIKAAACKMRDMDIGTLAVIDKGQLCGIITDSDICCRCISEDLDPSTTTVKEIMSTNITSCFSDQNIIDAAQIMEDSQIRRIAVMNRDETMAGLLSVDDLARGSHDLAGEVLESVSSMH